MKTLLFFSVIKCNWLIYFFVLLNWQKGNSQCGAPELLPTVDCETAPLICLQNWCFETYNIPVPGWNGFCGPNTAVHNPQYYQFIPTAGDITIGVHVDDCSGGNGLQSAIIQACPWEVSDVVACDPGAPPGATMFLTVSGLTIGEPAWLLIDGSSGSTCHYTITHTEGITEPEIFGQLSSLTINPTIATQGQSGIELEITSTITGAHGYYWVIDWYEDTITSTLPSTTIDIPCDVPEGIYTICARAFSGCDTTENEVCAEIEILPSEDVIKEPSTFCPEMFPFTWHNDTIFGPGLYTQEFQNSSGCSFDSIWQIDVFAESPVGLIDTAVCAFEFQYEGETYDSPGIYLLEYPGQNIYGCDSVAELHLALDGIRYFIEAPCTDTSMILTPHIIEHLDFSEIFSYAWYDCSFTPVQINGPEFSPEIEGCYSLILQHGSCVDTLSSTYNPDTCSTPCSIVSATGCLLEPTIFTFEGEIQENASMHWLIDQPGAPKTYFTGSDSIAITYANAGCYRASLTIVDSVNTYTCVDSFCIIRSTSIASICCSETTCDTCTTLTIDISGAAPWTIYISGPDGTDTITGITSSPYLHEVCPPMDSSVEYSIKVIDAETPCLALIPGEDTVTVFLSSSPLASIIQQVDTLCANELPNVTYQWLDCQTAEVLSTSSCFVPDTSGCYCVEITNQSGCTDTACYEFIISASGEIIDQPISISPIPSRGVWDVTFPSSMVTPVEWSLLDIDGRMLENGKLFLSSGRISLNQIPSSGFYFLKFTTGDGKSRSEKVIIQTE